MKRHLLALSFGLLLLTEYTPPVTAEPQPVYDKSGWLTEVNNLTIPTVGSARKTIIGRVAHYKEDYPKSTLVVRSGGKNYAISVSTDEMSNSDMAVMRDRILVRGRQVKVNAWSSAAGTPLYAENIKKWPVPHQSKIQVTSKPQTKKTHQYLTLRQKSAAKAAIRELQTLDSYVTTGMDLSGYRLAVHQMTPKVNGYISLLPQGAVRDNLHASCGFYDFVLQTWEGSPNLSPISRKTELEVKQWKLLQVFLGIASKSRRDAENLL